MASASRYVLPQPGRLGFEYGARQVLELSNVWRTLCCMTRHNAPPNPDKLDQVVAQARHAAEQREKGYRERALKMYPWVCGRCGREFTRTNVRELTVHHRNHNHDDNPPDGSNWELLCVYCHDNEHARHIDHVQGSTLAADEPSAAATGKPFGGLRELLNK